MGIIISKKVRRMMLISNCSIFDLAIGTLPRSFWRSDPCGDCSVAPYEFFAGRATASVDFENHFRF